MHNLRLTILTTLLCWSITAWSQLTFLQRVTPEQEGIRSSDMLAFMDTLMRQKDSDVHGIMVLRHGRVIGEKYNEPFAAEYSHTLYSASKTFTAVAVGLAIEDSLLHLTDHLVDFFPYVLPPTVSDSLSSITVHDLLCMQSGLPVDTHMRTIEKEWLRFYLAQPMLAMPGTKFNYDSIVTYLLSAIVQSVEGQKIIDLLKKRIFTPLGITEVAWEESPEGISCGGWGLYLQLESMAKFGQLLLQKGEWNGQQLISSEWIDMMTLPHASNSSGGRYGYQIWITNYPGMVRCDGAYGQYIFISPKHQTVVAITQCNRGSSALEHEMVWNLGANAKDVALATNEADYRSLQNARYRLTPTRGNAFSMYHRTKTHIRLGANDLKWAEIELDLKHNQSRKTLTATVITTTGEKFDLDCGYQTWKKNTIKGYPLNWRQFQNNFSNIAGPFYASASYGWTTQNDLYLRLHYVNWLTSCRLHFQFTGTGVAIDLLNAHTTKSVRILGELIK